MESVIKWRTGDPISQYMFCVITDAHGHVDIDVWDGERAKAVKPNTP